jgi:hypothetical protein
MSNPTLGAGSQFTEPFNILPDFNLISLNDTTVSVSQFSAPFNVLPDTIFTNPTTVYASQFIAASSIGTTIGIGSNPVLGFAAPTQQLSNPTLFDPGATQQFSAPFNMLPDPTFINPTLKHTSQFVEPSTQPITAAPSQTLYGPTEAGLSTPGTKDDKYADQFKGNANAENWQVTDTLSDFTNLNNSQFTRNGVGYASSIAAGALGFPQIGQSAQKIFDAATDQKDVVNSTYFTLPFNQLTNKLNFSGDTIDIVNSVGNLAPYGDFRSKRFASSFANQNANLAVKISSAIGKARKDGASAAIRPRNFSARAALYAATSLSPAGAYSLFNLNGVGEYGYGWGDHDSQFALRSDFTLRSEVTTRWATERSGSFVRTRNPVELVTPFRGDKVTVIDFGKRLLKNAYQWKPSSENGQVPKTSLTKDFIKFFLTGPTLTANNLFGDITGNNEGVADDIIVFRAILTSLSDTFSPAWTDVKMIGRADPNYHYGGFGRSLDLGFDIVITDRDEIKPTWRKLNALAGYCAPKYDGASIALTAPWMRITLGDLFHQTPAVMTSLSYTYDLDHSWEINIEGDKEMFETPRKISVSCNFNIISDAIPQNNGRFFGLAKQYDSTNTPIKGNDNWLSDFESNVPSRAFEQESLTTSPTAEETFEQRVSDLTAFTGFDETLDPSWP